MSVWQMPYPMLFNDDLVYVYGSFCRKKIEEERNGRKNREKSEQREI